MTCMLVKLLHDFGTQNVAINEFALKNISIHIFSGTITTQHLNVTSIAVFSIFPLLFVIILAFNIIHCKIFQFLIHFHEMEA